MIEACRLGQFANFEFVRRARVPIVKFDVYGIGCDLSMNFDNVSLLNTALLAFYANCDRRVVPLAHFVKQLAKLHDVNDAQFGTLHSYNWNLLVIFYLQRQNVLPVLDDSVIRPHVAVTDMARVGSGFFEIFLKSGVFVLTYTRL